MLPSKIKTLLPLIGSKFRGQRTGWVLATCPLRWNHGTEPSDAFAISTDPKKKSRYKCLSCGGSGDLMDLLMDIQFGIKKSPEYKHYFNTVVAVSMVGDEFADMELTPEDIPDFETPSEKIEVVFPEKWLDSFDPAVNFPEAVAYCKSRGLGKGVMVDLDLRYDPQQHRVGFPFRNFMGELMGLQGRYIGSGPVKDDEHPDAPLRYFQYGYYGKRNSHVWMGEHTLNLDETVILCEGPLDFSKIYQVYENVAASFTSGLSRTKVRRIADAEMVVTFYDYGKGGDAARASIRKYLPGMPIVDIIPTKEEDDAGNMSLVAITNYLEEHVGLT